MSDGKKKVVNKLSVAEKAVLYDRAREWYNKKTPGEIAEMASLELGHKVLTSSVTYIIKGLGLAPYETPEKLTLASLAKRVAVLENRVEQLLLDLGETTERPEAPRMHEALVALAAPVVQEPKKKPHWTQLPENKEKLRAVAAAGTAALKAKMRKGD